MEYIYDKFNQTDPKFTVIEWHWVKEHWRLKPVCKRSGEVKEHFLIQFLCDLFLPKEYSWYLFFLFAKDQCSICLRKTAKLSGNRSKNLTMKHSLTPCTTLNSFPCSRFSQMQNENKLLAVLKVKGKKTHQQKNRKCLNALCSLQMSLWENDEKKCHRTGDASLNLEKPWHRGPQF